MTLVEQLAASVMGSSYDNLSLAARDQLKIRILDSLGCAIAALNGESIRAPAHCCKTLRGLAPCALRRSAFNGWRRRNLWYGRESTALRATRTGMLSHWKELAYPNTAFGATHAAFLAGRGIIGPLEVFEGNKGFMDAIVGHFDIDWSKEGLERVTRTIVKKYNAEIQSQSAIEGTQELKPEHHVAGHDVERIDIEIFDVAHNIIGGGDKTIVRTKEQAGHGLRCMVATAILDGQVMPEQYLPERIQRSDVQNLLQKVVVRASSAYSLKFSNTMPGRIMVHLGQHWNKWRKIE